MAYNDALNYSKIFNMIGLSKTPNVLKNSNMLSRNIYAVEQIVVPVSPEDKNPT